jgi:hypothetical protein
MYLYAVTTALLFRLISDYGDKFNNNNSNNNNNNNNNNDNMFVNSLLNLKIDHAMKVQ